jgi:hypothetical protein
MNIKVKPLEWNWPGNSHESVTKIGVFSITACFNNGEFDLFLEDEHIGAFNDFSEAKQAAQDYVRDVVMQLIEVE